MGAVMSENETKKGEKDTVALTLKLNRKDWLAFRSRTAEDGKSMQGVLEDLVKAYLASKT